MINLIIDTISVLSSVALIVMLLINRKSEIRFKKEWAAHMEEVDKIISDLKHGIEKNEK